MLMLAPSYLPRRGGVEKHVQMVCRELAAAGLQVRLAAPRWEEDWPARETIEGLEVTRLDRSASVGRRTLKPLVDWASLVHTHDAYPFLKYYLPYRFLRPRTPAFVTFHGYEGYPIPLEAKVLRRLVQWLTRGSICAGAFIPKWYRFRCSHVTHGGVDAPAERPPLGRGALFAGRLEPDTGFVTYLEALRLLRIEHNVELPLEVCGDGSLREQAEKLAAEAGLDVTFHGRVPDIMPYLRNCRFAFVSGLLAMLEAMACGRAVFAVYDNPLKEDYLRLFPGAEHCVIAGTAQDLAAELQRCLAEPDLIEAKGAAGYEFARTQTWRRVAELYMDLYLDWLKGRGSW